jgi:glycosyltransferase involved in cell wall biosynthesis
VSAPVIVHVTTVPMSLAFLRAQPGFMRTRGFETVAISSPGPDLQRFGREEGVSVAAVDMTRRITPIRDVAAVLELRRVLRQLDPVIVHAHTPKGGLLGMIAATLARVPVRIYHMRGLAYTGATGPRRRLLYAAEWLSCRLAHSVLCVSHSIRAVALEEGLCPGNRITVLAGGSGQGVDATGRFNPGNVAAGARWRTRARFGIPAGAVVVGFVGRIVRDKGITELEDGWRALREGIPDLHLLLVGPFEGGDPVPADVERRLRSDPRVHLAGMDWNTPELYAAMDMVVLPSYREGFPNVPLEAAAMGLPVVATRIPGCTDAVLDGVTGTLVEPRSRTGLVAAIRAYVAEPGLRSRHGTAGRERVLRHFRPETIREALHGHYRSLLERPAVLADRAGNHREDRHHAAR